MADKTYRVRLNAGWEFNVEAEDEYSAELLAEDYVYGQYGFELTPEYFDAWAELVEKEETDV